MAALNGLLLAARAGDTVTLTNGQAFVCTVVRYEDRMLFYRGEGNLTNAIPLDAVRQVAFQEAPPPAQPPAKPAAGGEVRSIAFSDLDRRQREKGYLLLQLPTRYSGMIWLTFDKPQYQSLLVGAHRQSGVTWRKVFDTVFDRSGQMVFEMKPGKYRVNVFAVSSGQRKMTLADGHPPGQLLYSPDLDITAGNISTYSIKRIRPVEVNLPDTVPLITP